MIRCPMALLAAASFFSISATAATSPVSAPPTATANPEENSFSEEFELRAHRKDFSFGMDWGEGYFSPSVQWSTLSSIWHQADEVKTKERVIAIDSETDGLYSGLQLKMVTAQYDKVSALQSFYTIGFAHQGRLLPVGCEFGIGPSASALQNSLIAGSFAFFFGSREGFQMGYIYQFPMSRTDRPGWLVDQQFALRMSFPEPVRHIETWTKTATTGQP